MWSPSPLGIGMSKSFMLDPAGNPAATLACSMIAFTLDVTHP